MSADDVTRYRQHRDGFGNPQLVYDSEGGIVLHADHARKVDELRGYISAHKQFIQRLLFVAFGDKQMETEDEYVAALEAKLADAEKVNKVLVDAAATDLPARLRQALREIENIHQCLDYEGIPRTADAQSLADLYARNKEWAVAEIDFDRAAAWRDLQREMQAKSGKVELPLVCRIAAALARAKSTPVAQSASEERLAAEPY